MLPLISGLVNVDWFMITKLLQAVTRNLNLNYTDLGIVTGASCHTGDCRFVHGEFVRPDRAIVGAILIFSLPGGDKRIGERPCGAGCCADSHGAPRRGVRVLRPSSQAAARPYCCGRPRRGSSSQSESAEIDAFPLSHLKFVLE